MMGGLLYNPIINWLIALVLLFYGPVLIIVLIYKVLGGFTGYMSLFRYVGGNSFIYRLDPRTKILLAIILTIVAAMTIWWVSAIFLAGVLFLYAFLKDPAAKMRVAGPPHIVYLHWNGLERELVRPPVQLSIFDIRSPRHVHILASLRA